MTKITVITSLFRCEKYIEGYFSHLNKLINKDEIEVLLLHNDPQVEEMTLINKYLPGMPFVKHIVIKERESLYATWNRGCKLAQGKYIAVWNVDDIRFPDSLAKQAQILDENPDVVFPYGNYYQTIKYGDLTGKLLVERDCAKLRYRLLPKYSCLLACFTMWRKSLHEEIGYFDDQFKLAADYEFQIRGARVGKLKKGDFILGCYLSGDPNRLSKNTELQQTEVAAIERRYGIYYKMNVFFAHKANKYDINHVHSFGKTISINNYLPKLRIEKVCNCLMLPAQLLLTPYNFLREIKHKIEGRG